MSFSRTLGASDEQAWADAVEHPFMIEAAEGTLPAERFDVWVQQDRLFVLELKRFIARLIEMAPSADHERLRAGLAALEPELELFESYATGRGISLGVEPSPACREYLDFLGNCLEQSYAHAVTAYYACELAYLSAWQGVRERVGLEGPYREWVANWTSEPFRDYVSWLGGCVDEAAADLSPKVLDELRETFTGTVRHEVAFWDACAR